MNLSKREGAKMRIFLTGDGVLCARKGQKTPDGYYNVERMVKSLAGRGEVATWGSCSEARGLEPVQEIDGVVRGNLDLEGSWTLEADQVLIF